MCYKSPNFTTIRLRSLKKDTPQPHKTKMSLGFQTMQALYEPPVSVNKRTKGKPLGRLQVVVNVNQAS